MHATIISRKYPNVLINVYLTRELVLSVPQTGYLDIPRVTSGRWNAGVGGGQIPHTREFGPSLLKVMMEYV